MVLSRILLKGSNCTDLVPDTLCGKCKKFDLSRSPPPLSYIPGGSPVAILTSNPENLVRASLSQSHVTPHVTIHTKSGAPIPHGRIQTFYVLGRPML